MKITLISPYPDITSFGIRTISAYLRKRGHRTKLLFLPDPYGDNIVPGVQRYDDHILDGILPLCAGSDIVGITLMTNFYAGAVQISRKIKSKLEKPILWGGIHPTICPEESLKHADMVCIGDGEDSVLDLLDKMEKNEPYEKTKGFWFKNEGQIIKNGLRELTSDLDVYPFPDYSLDDHYMMFENKIQAMTKGLVRISMERSPLFNYAKRCVYQTIAGRGCPHKCAYCVNDTLKSLYRGQSYLRWRSTENVINELLWVKNNMPFVSYIWFSDDSFLARNLETIKEFCIQYKKRVRMPFFVLTSPLMVSQEKMDLLVDAGLRCVQMGIQTGSKRIQGLFNRKQMSNERSLGAAHIINKYKDKMLPPRYDFILDTPYETDNDKIKSLQLISRIPKPFMIQTFSLVLFPGTSLYEMAKSDGMIRNEEEEIYNRTVTQRRKGYLNMLFSLCKRGRLPGSLLRFLISARLVSIIGSKRMEPLLRRMDILSKVLYHYIKGR